MGYFWSFCHNSCSSNCHCLLCWVQVYARSKSIWCRQNKTSLIGSHFENQVSSVQAATPPTTGEASRIPRREHSRFEENYLFCDIYFINCHYFSWSKILNLRSQRLLFFLDPIHGQTGTPWKKFVFIAEFKHRHAEVIYVHAFFLETKSKTKREFWGTLESNMDLWIETDMKWILETAILR